MTRVARLRTDARLVGSLVADFERVRDELGVPDAFPPEVSEEAERAAAAPVPLDGRVDLRDVEFVTVDPPGSRDLDQAVQLERAGDGYVVRYAIADVGAWVRRGGAVEGEAFRRGVTFYSPDGRRPLYPPVLGEGAASLLEGQDRPAIVFTHRLDAEGERRELTVERAMVRSRRQLSYEQVQREGHPLLEEVGRLRIALEDRRDALRIDAPGQEIVPDETPAGYRLRLESRLPVEDWNAQISLLTGIAAAELMLQHGIGLLRTMADPDPENLAAARRVADALGVPWPADGGLDDLLRRLDRSLPRDAAMIEAARRAMEPADYTAFAGGEPPPVHRHAAIAAPYAHVTAPLRRLADRYVLDLLVALAEGAGPPPGAAGDLARAAETMNRAEGLEGRLERALVDAVEARLLEGRVDETFTAVVIGVRSGAATIVIPDPPVRATLKTDPLPAVGTAVDVRLAAVDVEARRLSFEPLAAPTGS